MSYGNKYEKGPVETVKQEEPQKKETFPTLEEIGNGLMVFVAGTALGLIIYLLAVLSLKSFNVGYILGAVIALTIAILVIWAIDKSMGFKNSKMQAAVVMVLCVAFIFTILNGYKETPNKKDEAKMRTKTVEMVTLNSAGEVWFTDKVFKVGTEIQIEVTYNDVLMVNCYNLPVGVHRKIISHGGKLIFRGLVNNPAQIKITY